MIILDEGTRYEIRNGRLVALIRWLITYRDRFEDKARVQLTFDCAGDRANATVKERSDVDPTLFITE